MPYGIKVNAIMPMAHSKMTEPAFGQVMAEPMPPEGVAPFVGLLCDEAVPVTGETFTVARGIAARVVLFAAEGYVARNPSIADYLANFDRVMELGGGFVPTGGIDDLRHRMGQLGITLQGF